MKKAWLNQQELAWNALMSPSRGFGKAPATLKPYQCELHLSFAEFNQRLAKAFQTFAEEIIEDDEEPLEDEPELIQLCKLGLKPLDFMMKAKPQLLSQLFQTYLASEMMSYLLPTPESEIDQRSYNFHTLKSLQFKNGQVYIKGIASAIG